MCGNGKIDGDEDCDGDELNGESCASATMNAQPGGTLGCRSDCRFDTSDCTEGGGGTLGGGGTFGGGGTLGGGGAF